MSNYVLNNWGNFDLQLLRHFRDTTVFTAGSFLLLHPVDYMASIYNDCFICKLSSSGT